jgi:hypothetical protein
MAVGKVDGRQVTRSTIPGSWLSKVKAKANQTPILRHAWPAGEVGRHSVSPGPPQHDGDSPNRDSVLFSAGAGRAPGTGHLRLCSPSLIIPVASASANQPHLSSSCRRVLLRLVLPSHARTPTCQRVGIVVLPACHVAPLRSSLQDGYDCWQPSCGTDARSTGGTGYVHLSRG